MDLTVSNEDGIDFGVVQRHGVPPVFPTQTVALTIEASNFHPEVKLVELGFVSTREQSGRTIRFAASLHGESQWIEQGHARTVTVTFTPLYEGSFAETLELTFRVINGSDIIVTRPVRGVAGLSAAVAPADSALRAELPVHPQPLSSDGVRAVSSLHTPPTSGQNKPSPQPQTRGRPIYLPEFPLPPDLKQTVLIADEKQHEKAVRSIAQKFLLRTLDIQSYGRYWQRFLWIEETRLQHELEHVIVQDVDVEAAHPRYKVHFTEDEDNEAGIPDIKRGDYVMLIDILSNTRSLGRIHTYDTHYRTIHLQGGSSRTVTDVNLSLSMRGAFTLVHHANYSLRFKLNRMPLRRMHQAVTMAMPGDLCRLLFPAPTHVTVRANSRDEDDIRDMFLYNADIRNDRKQMQCILSITRQPAGSVPFIIYGPPGTGKTVTTVESILQLLRKDTTTRILACAQTNAAADLLVARLYELLSKEELFRLNAQSRNPDDVATEHADAVLDCSVLDEDGNFEVPPARTLMLFRVVICTCSTAGTLQLAGFPRGHFSHIFIDEAAQAMEPEAMIPIRMMADEETNVVLAGDKEQLRPVVKGLESRLSMSYVERLMRIKEVYGLDSNIGRSGQTIVQLQTNRRSHPAIVAFSNTYIYEDSLEARGDPAVTMNFLRSPILKNASFPIVFVGVQSKAVKAKNSNSLYNEEEANTVRSYCQRLLRDNDRPVRPEEIGVITPYKAQAKQIRKSLGRALGEVSVGSVEQFQGQERRVIIVSTVRSMLGNANRTAGFLKDRNRLNVVLTRAKALVIVIGDPIMLGKAGLWRHFLNYVHSHGGCLGEQFDWNPDNEADIVPAGYDRTLREQPATWMGPEFVERMDFESTILRYIADPMLRRG